MDQARLTGSDIVTLHRPSRCALRVYLRELGIAESEPSPYSQLLIELGNEHEQQLLATFDPSSIFDVSQIPIDERCEQTIAAVDRGDGVIYQGALRGETELNGQPVTISGYPDFLLRTDQSGYAIRDSKISRRISVREHPEIFAQLGLYLWLYEQTFGIPPVALEVHSGANEVIPIEETEAAVQLAFRALEEVFSARSMDSEPYEPVGWSKCQSCGFRDRCWSSAVAEKQVAIIPELNQTVAHQLHSRGILTVADLLAEYDVKSLQEFKGVGEKSAIKIMRNSRAVLGDELEVFAPVELPGTQSVVMFDLEGIPPHLDSNEKIYVWGMKVFGERPSEFMPAVASFREEGDSAGWFDFLTLVARIVTEYGELPFVHWAAYERTMIGRYVERYGDPDGTAALLLDNLLLDLLPLTKNSVALPIASYSLKVVEKFVGFERELLESNGDWAIAQFIKATEQSDQVERDRLVGEVLRYNEEDLDATWAVYEWLRGLDAYTNVA